MLLSFVVNLYTLPFNAEFFLVPIIFVFAVLRVIADTRAELKSAKIFIDIILGLIGMMVFTFAIWGVTHQIETLSVSKILLSFLIPILLSLSYVPYLYLMALYIAYEWIFARINIHVNDDKVASFMKREIVIAFNVNLNKVKHFIDNGYKDFHRIREREDVIRLVRQYK